MQELAFTLADGIGYVEECVEARPRRRRLRAAALVLLRRPQRLLRGDRQVPRRAPHLGARHEGALRREERRDHEAAHARADRRRLAHRAAAVQQRRARRAPGAGRGARRHAVAAHQLARRDLRAAHRGGRDDRAAHAADHRRRERRGPTPSIRSAAATSSSSSPTRWRSEALDYIRRIDEMGGMVRAIEKGYPQREIGGERLPLPARGRAGRAGHGRRERVQVRTRTRRSRCCASTRRWPQEQSRRLAQVKAERDADGGATRRSPRWRPRRAARTT